MASNIILKHGGHRRLLSCQKSRIVYEVTVIFCNRFLNFRDRTVDQMVQAARSGKHNIVAGSMVSETSREMEIKLTNAARASMEELLEDYHDYLRIHRCRLWSKNSPEAIYMRKLSRNLHETEAGILDLAKFRKAPEVCNMAICLIHQVNCLLDQQIGQLEKSFPATGGLRMRTNHARRMAR